MRNAFKYHNKQKCQKMTKILLISDIANHICKYINDKTIYFTKIFEIFILFDHD